MLTQSNLNLRPSGDLLLRMRCWLTSPGKPGLFSAARSVPLRCRHVGEQGDIISTRDQRAGAVVVAKEPMKAAIERQNHPLISPRTMPTKRVPSWLMP